MGHRIIVCFIIRDAHKPTAYLFSHCAAERPVKHTVPGTAGDISPLQMAEVYLEMIKDREADDGRLGRKLDGRFKGRDKLGC